MSVICALLCGNQSYSHGLPRLWYWYKPVCIEGQQYLFSTHMTELLVLSGKSKQGKSEGFDSCDLLSDLTLIGSKSSIFQPCDLEIWLMTSKNYRAPLLHYIKLCASSQTPRWIRTAVAVRKHSIWVKIGDCLPCVTLKFNGWPWKTKGILFYVILSFVHHFKAIGEFKLKL